MSGTEDDDSVSLFFLFFATLLSSVLLMSRCLKSRPKLNSVLSEPAMVLLFGMLWSFVIRCVGTVNAGASSMEEDDQFAADDGDGADGESSGSNWTHQVLSFPNKVFFMALLPPILFFSGYELQRELFYRHFKPIVLFSALGTTISGFVTASVLHVAKNLGWLGGFDPSFLELLTFGSLIAATDTVSVLGVLQAKRVDPHLFSLVFGESALNDAVAIVLFRSFSSMLEEGIDNSGSAFHIVGRILVDFFYQAVGSPALGIVFAFLVALIFKHADLRETKLVELSLFVLLMYFPFLLAEEFHMSGIVAIFFAGLSARRYIEPNVSDETKKVAATIFHLIAYLAETCIFLELGLSVFGQQNSSIYWQFVLFAFFAALLGRAFSVYPISFAFNFSLQEPVGVPLIDIDDHSTGSGSTVTSLTSWSPGRRRRTTPEKRKDKTIPLKFMHVMWFTGLRGAVAYSCARDFPDLYGHNDEFTVATMFIVFVTIVVMGGGTEPLLDFLQIRMGVDEKEYMKAWRQRRRLKGFFHDSEYRIFYSTAVREVSEKHDDIIQSSSGLSGIENGFQPVKEVELVRGVSPCSRELSISPSDDDDFTSELGKAVSTKKNDTEGSEDTSKR